MIFNKQFEDITFEDIQALKDNQVSESEFLEYKSQFDTDEAAKLVSAFANTYGGFIVYGILNDDKSNVPKEIVGIDDKGLEDRLDSICYDKITPPVFCERKYLEDSQAGIFVFLVRVPESDLTPHGIEGNTKWYVKVRGQKRPYSRADFDRLEWLRERRKKHIELRNELTERSHRISTALLGSVPHGSHWWLDITLVPCYPRAALIEYTELREFLRGFTSSFGPLSHNDLLHVHDGFAWVKKGNDDASCTQLNCYGLYHSLIRKRLLDGSNTKTLRVDQLVSDIVPTLNISLEVLRDLGFWGSVEVNCRLKGFRGTDLYCEFPRQIVFRQLQGYQCQLEDRLVRQEVFEMRDYQRSIDKFVIDFLSRLFFAYGIQDYALGAKVYQAFTRIGSPAHV